MFPSSNAILGITSVLAIWLHAVCYKELSDKEFKIDIKSLLIFFVFGFLFIVNNYLINIGITKIIISIAMLVIMYKMLFRDSFKDNMDKMKSGSIYEVADVVRNLSYKQKEKGLSTGEKKMLNNAKQILISELVLAEHASENEVVDLVENKINLSFEEHRTLGETPNTNNIVSKFIPFNNTTNTTDSTQNL